MADKDERLLKKCYLKGQIDDALQKCLAEYYNKKGVKSGDITPEYNVVWNRILDSTSELFLQLEELNTIKTKTIEEMDNKYHVTGDDREIAYGAYQNLVTVFSGALSPEDAECIVYETLNLDADYIANDYKDAMDYLTSVSGTLNTYIDLPSGKIAVVIE